MGASVLPWVPRRVWCVRGSGCWGEGDGVAECFELSDVVAFLGLWIEVCGVVVGAEVGVGGVGVGQQVPDDDQDGASDGDDGAFVAASSGDASVALPEEGVGAAGGDGGLAQDLGQVAVAVAGVGFTFGFYRPRI